ncbi:NAD(P)-dependent alcohol dehydrogenase [Erwinia persicina]|uniref:NAD(P)-dependent alcohol dehydrogenase n=1 Tax=Erwinia persicina TaxID=55211 RepID=UPI00177F3356|nr:NAD(P)-dependent alcohol dehydrogenase [Erwinia persicina]MBD8216332.1 NAD(P)-dependent alcohol dehydrogenase [Erwinia persicina]
MKITAAVINHVNAPYQLEPLELTALRDDEVRVKVVASGICHSDEALRVGDEEHFFPGVLGHEGSGIVEEVGRSVKGVTTGDHVVMSYAYCGCCDRCRQGQPSHCQHWGMLNAGGFRTDGSAVLLKPDGGKVSTMFSQSSFATHTHTRLNNLIVVDKSADLRLVAPLGCGLLTGSATVFNGLKPQPGSDIAIFGTGAVGMAAIMAAKIAGCRHIIAIDIHDTRLSLARELGATDILNSSKEEVVSAIASLTQGKGVNYAIDTTGLSAVMKSALDALATGGTLVPLAVTRHDLTFNPMRSLVASSRRVAGILMGNAIPQVSVPKLIEWHQRGWFPFEKLVKYYDFADINQARADSASGVTIKPVLIVDKGYRI